MTSMMAPLLPEIFIALLTATLLGLTLVSDTSRSSELARKASLVFAIGALISSVLTFRQPETVLFFGSYQIDRLSQFFKMLFSGSFAFVIGLSAQMTQPQKDKRVEYFLFLTSATLGLMVLASAIEMLTLFIGLELAAYSLYLLVPLKKTRAASEAAVKYMIFGAMMSGIFLYGLSLLMGLTQTTYLYAMTDPSNAMRDQTLYLIALFFVLGPIFFKLSVFPFHFWAPDAYEAAPTTAVAFIATASKAAAAAVILRLLSNLGISEPMVGVLGLVAVGSMAVGNLAALWQRDVKRLLAYSSIAQGGYLLVALLTGTADGYAAVFFYATAYVVMNLGAFWVVVRVGRVFRTDNPAFQHFNGLADRSPLTAFILLLSLLSLAGIPPLIGFTGKWFLFAAAMRDGHVLLVLTGVIFSVISLFYYLTLVKHAYLLKSPPVEWERPNLGFRAVGLALFAILIFFGVFPAPLLNTAQRIFG